MRIARRGDPPAIQIAGLIQLAQLFQGLTAMIVRGGILGIGGQNSLELLNRAIQVAGPDVLHRQPVAREGVGGIVGQELPQGFEPGVVSNLLGYSSSRGVPLFCAFSSLGKHRMGPPTPIPVRRSV